MADIKWRKFKMNRKQFIKSTALVVGGITLMPNIIIPKYKDDVDKLKWFSDNYHWLEKWLDNYKEINLPLKEIYNTMQRFMDNVPIIGGGELYLKHKRKEHKIQILHYAVFSKHSFYQAGDERLATMSGFLEQKGRLPNKRDRVLFEVCPPDKTGKRFLRERKVRDYEGRPSIQILSDCRLKVLT